MTDEESGTRRARRAAAGEAGRIRSKPHGDDATERCSRRIRQGAFDPPLVGLPLVVSDRRTLGRLGRWNQAHSGWVKVALALIVVAMSVGLLYTL